MSVKLYRRGFVIKNLLLFMLLSLIYIHILNAIDQGVSAFNISILSAFISQYLYLALLSVLVFLSVMYAKKISKLLFILYCLIISIDSIIIFFSRFDKLVLALLFVFILTSVCFAVSLILELEEAIYHPGFYKMDLDKNPLLELNVSVETKTGKKFSGKLTNWDCVSCFVLLDKNLDSYRGKLTILIEFEGRIFNERGSIYSLYDGGIGIKFMNNAKSINDDIYNWNDFFTVISDRGYKTSLLGVY